ncbi:MAG: hypothetical protein FJW39_21115 [Acidobacteria bacterium]|nr:hypothetical protein [Acidobacteriota bacterium]
MRASIHILSIVLTAAGSALAQQWEVGGLAGGGFYRDKSVTGPRGTGSAGFQRGFSAGGWLGHNSTGRVGGEIRYLYQSNPMQVRSGSNSYSFSGHSHAFHYDFLLHANSIEEPIRPFLAVGGGMKVFRGTGTERAIQPLSNVAILTRTLQWQPVITFGGGVKVRLGSKMTLRAEVRDYLSPFPKDVILPAPGAKLGGWLHDITPMVGISYLFQ